VPRTTEAPAPPDAPQRPGKKNKSCSECKLRNGRHAPGCSQEGCQFCHAQVGHQPDCPEFEAPDTVFKLENGGVYEGHDGTVRRVHAIAGGIIECTEGDGKDVEGFSRTDFLDWVKRRVDAAPGAIKTTVNGEEAKVVVDGTVAKPAEQMRLIKGDPDEITGRMRRKNAELTTESLELAEREAAHKEQKKLVERIQGELNAIVNELCDATSPEGPDDDPPPEIGEEAAARIAETVMNAGDDDDTEGDE
jgi:hypothetical protein